MAVPYRAPDGEWPSWEQLIRLATDAGPEHGALAMATQRFSIKGRVISGDDPLLQDALAQVHESSERPRCLCVPGGIEMYVARHRYFVAAKAAHTSRAPDVVVEPREPAGVPSCPRCGSAMLRREARKGAQAGQLFWGCPKFPECRGTRPIS